MDFNYLISLLSPIAPLLLKPSEKIAEGFIHKMGADAFDKAKKITDKLRPHLKEDPDIEKAVELFINEPNNQASQELLKRDLKRILNSKKILAQEIALIIEQISEYPKIDSHTKSNKINSNGKYNTIQNGSNNIAIGKARDINISEK